MAIPKVAISSRLRALCIVTAFAVLFSLVLPGCIKSGNGDDNNEAVYYESDQDYPYSPGWYRGDLHSHAWYVAGAWLTPIADVIDIAEIRGFDFFVLTNHETVFQWDNSEYQSTQLTLLYGVEWTSLNGHANIWSDRPFDWDAISPTSIAGNNEGAINTAHNQSTLNHPVLFSINHPDLDEDGLLSWQASLEESSEADTLEVWNHNSILISPTDIFTTYIDHALKMTMVGGSDAHLTDSGDMQSFAARLGRPTTWVYAESRSGKDILTGIKQGHVFISASPEGPRLDFTADTSLGVLRMGDTIPMSDLGNPVSFTVSVSAADVPYGIVLVKNGVPQEPWSRVCSDPEDSVTFSDSPLAGDYYRVEVRQLTALPSTFDELLQGTISSISNPLYTW